MWKANFIAAIAATTLKSYFEPSTIASGGGMLRTPFSGWPGTTYCGRLMTSTYKCGFSNRNRLVSFTPMHFRPCFCSSGRSMTRSRRSRCGGNSPSRPGFSRRTFRRASKRRSSSRSSASSALAWAVMISCCGAGQLDRQVAELQVLLTGRLATTLGASSPQHIDQPVVGGFQFRHPLAKRVALAGDDPRGVHQGLVIAAESAELREDAIQGRTQGRQFAAQRFVALLPLAQLFSKQRVVHDATILIGSP